MGRLDVFDKYRDEDYPQDNENIGKGGIGMESKEVDQVVVLNDEMNPAESDAVSKVIKKQPFWTARSGRTIGSQIPRARGKGANRDLSPYGKV